MRDSDRSPAQTFRDRESRSAPVRSVRQADGQRNAPVQPHARDTMFPQMGTQRAFHRRSPLADRSAMHAMPTPAG